jgi:uncharacterized membrane protein
MTAIVGGCLLVYAGHPAAGATIATTSVGTLAGVFVLGTRMQQKERERKALIMMGQPKQKR